MTETQERFLRNVLARVAVDTVVELHLFTPIRRGTMETGVAVIATVLPPAPLTVLGSSPVNAGTDANEADANEADANESEAIQAVATDVSARADAADGDDASPYAEAMPAPDARVGAASADQANHADDASDSASDDGNGQEIAAPEPHVPAPRLRILTAAYRHTIKGIERGAWAVDVQEEAHAPLEAVEAVLRGVRHRSNEPADPELVGHDTLAALMAPARVAPAA